MSESNAKLVEDVLGNLPMFRHVAPAHLHRLARHAQLRRVAKDTLLYRSGDPATGCYALVYGLVKLSLRAPDGAEKVLRLVGAGETFAESVMFHEQPQPVNALVLADSQLVFLPAQAIFDLLDHDRTFVRALLASLSQRIHTLIADIESYSLANGTQRIAAFLNSLADAPGPEQARVRLPANKTVIASRLGITKETFSRLLHELSSQGLIEVCQREVVLRDPQRLADLARGGAKA
ncbi:MAG TPA: Crp/Fnr family transcriptional regulator [Burkholderiales bacterium]|nr:Crp/Fnr family transcriptional regulator [Burkholderiales bacterium]